RPAQLERHEMVDLVLVGDVRHAVASVYRVLQRVRRRARSRRSRTRTPWRHFVSGRRLASLTDSVCQLPARRRRAPAYDGDLARDACACGAHPDGRGHDDAPATEPLGGTRAAWVVPMALPPP